MIWNDRLHRHEIDNVDALIESDPESVEVIFCYTPTRLAVQVKPGCHHVISVISYQTSAIS